MPAISPDSLYGAVHLPGDGHLDPHGATHAVAEAARALGVRIRTGMRVTGFELSPRREVTRVLTDHGPIDTELVVNAAGIWAPQVAAMVGGFVPSTPVDHQHVALQGRAGFTSCRATCRASAIRTTSSTARASTAAWSSAGTRRTPSRAGWTACRGTTRPPRCRRIANGSRRSWPARSADSRSWPTRRRSGSSAIPMR